MEETTTSSSLDFSSVESALSSVYDVLMKIMSVYRTIIDALKSVIKPVLKSGIDAISGAAESSTDE